MQTIKQELKTFAKKLMDDKIDIRTYVKEHTTGDEEEWLAKAIFNSHVFAIHKACNLLRDIAVDSIEIDALESKLMIADLNKSRV